MAIISKAGGSSTHTSSSGATHGGTSGSFGTDDALLENGKSKVTMTKAGRTAALNGESGDGGYSSGYGSGGYGGGGYEEYSNPWQDYLAALQAQRDELLAQANAHLDEQGRLGEQRYALQKEAADQDYQDLKNQSEVNRYKARSSLRESLANRGAMDSGVGRQAYLNLDTNYGNALNRIGLQQRREDAERNQAIQEMWNQIAMQKTANEMMGLDMMGNILSQIDPSYLSAYSYSPTTSQNYAAASNVVQKQNPAEFNNPAIGNAQYETGAGTAARAQAFDDILRAARNRNQFNAPAYDPYKDPSRWGY